MYKSASTSQFENTSFGYKTFSGFQKNSHEIDSPCLIKKHKKLGVQFNLEEDKENKNHDEIIFETSTYQRKDKKSKTLTEFSSVSQKEKKKLNNNFHDFTGNFEKATTKRENIFDFPEKNSFVEEKSFIYENKTTNTLGKCKSLKLIPSLEHAEEFTEPTLSKKKSERKFQNFTAFDGLLKESENLIEKYKKLDNDKNKLKDDLQNQIETYSKSSKKIVFLEEKENEKKCNYQEKYNFLEGKLINSKITENSSDRKTFNTFNAYGNYKAENSEFGFKEKKHYDLGNDNIFSQTFSEKSELFSTKSSFASKKDLNSFSYDGSFGLYKNKSTKKLSPTGLSLEDFELGKVLGSGAFGEVFPAKHKETGWIFALKKIKKASVKHMLDQFIQEIKIQLFLDHPNIVKLYSFFDDELHFYILMEYMEGGSLYSELKKKKTLTLEETSLKLSEICEGLQHMHDNSVIHRDIKPENIVLSHNVSKLCDFGWSAICKGRRTTYCGTLDYVCPEIIEGEEYDDSVDIWSIGVLAYELLVGKTPFYNISRQQTLKRIVDCNLEFPSSIPKVAINFISNILKKNPEHRQTIEQILKDPLLKISQNLNQLL